MSGADVAGLSVTERSRILLFLVRNVAANLAILFLPPVSSQGNQFSSIASGRLRLLHFPVELAACPFQLAFADPRWRFSVFHLLLVLPLSHRLVLIALSYQRPHSDYGVLVSRFQRAGTKKSGFALHFVAIPSFLKAVESSYIGGRSTRGRECDDVVADQCRVVLVLYVACGVSWSVFIKTARVRIVVVVLATEISAACYTQSEYENLASPLI